MVKPGDVGSLAVVRAAGEYYSFIDGWRGVIEGVSSGLFVLRCESMECGAHVVKRFMIPADELEVVNEQ